MDISAVFSVVKKVLLDERVIAAVIAVVVYLDFVRYVQRYHKKPPKLRTVRKTAVPAAAPGKKEGNASSEDTTGNGQPDAADTSEQEEKPHSGSTGTKK